MSNRKHLIGPIVDKLWSAYRNNLELLLDIGKAITDRANSEIRFNKTKDKNHNDQ